LRALAPPPAPASPARKGESTAADHRHEAQQRKREAATRRRELAATKKALSAASRAARQAETAVEASRRALAATRQERDRLQDQLQFAVKKIDSAAADLREREARLIAAKQEVARLEEKLRIY
jgi:chromosome segregation ATPase